MSSPSAIVVEKIIGRETAPRADGDPRISGSRHVVERASWACGKRPRRPIGMASLVSLALHLGLLASLLAVHRAPIQESRDIEPVPVPVVFTAPAAPSATQVPPAAAPAPPLEPMPPAQWEPPPETPDAASPPEPVPQPSPPTETPAPAPPQPAPQPVAPPAPPAAAPPKRPTRQPLARPPRPEASVTRPRPALPRTSAQPDSPAAPRGTIEQPGAGSAAGEPAMTQARPVGGAIRPPPYPEQALRRNEQGRVLIRVEVAPDGTPLSVSLAQSSGSTVLDDAALTAVRHARFSPATRGGMPVAGTAEVPIVFRLEE